MTKAERLCVVTKLGEYTALTSIPSNARTVSLLPSLALRSPTSPGRSPSTAKCTVSAALEPPATAPHSARSAPLRQRATTRKDEFAPGFTKGYSIDRVTNAKYGDRVSEIIAASFKMSARRRYVFASGVREVPR